MESERVVFLTTSDIFRTNGFFGSKAEEDEEVKAVLSDGRKAYTTGRLEHALAAGYQVVVVTTRTHLYSHDEWWIEMIGRENVFLSDPDMVDSVPESHRATVEYSIGWMLAFQRLGAKWPSRGELGNRFNQDVPAHWTEVRSVLEKLDTRFVLGKKAFRDIKDHGE